MGLNVPISAYSASLSSLLLGIEAASRTREKNDIVDNKKYST